MKIHLNFLVSVVHFSKTLVPQLYRGTVFIANSKLLQQRSSFSTKSAFVETSCVWGSKKSHRKIKLQLLNSMADPKIEEILAPLRQDVKEQVTNILQHTAPRHNLNYRNTLFYF